MLQLLLCNKLQYVVSEAIFIRLSGTEKWNFTQTFFDDFCNPWKKYGNRHVEIEKPFIESGTAFVEPLAFKKK